MSGLNSSNARGATNATMLAPTRIPPMVRRIALTAIRAAGHIPGFSRASRSYRLGVAIFRLGVAIFGRGSGSLLSRAAAALVPCGDRGGDYPRARAHVDAASLACLGNGTMETSRTQEEPHDLAGWWLAGPPRCRMFDPLTGGGHFDTTLAQLGRGEPRRMTDGLTHPEGYPQGGFRGRRIRPTRS
jgi:hypothetical protein